MRLRYIFPILLTFVFCLSVSGMDYGLRFKSHSASANTRTSLSLGDGSFRFDDELSVEFKIHFYDKDCFGLVCTLTGDDGTIVSLVSSAEDKAYKAGILVNDKITSGPIMFPPAEDAYINSSLTLDRRRNVITFRYGTDSFTVPANLAGVKGMSVNFGRTYEQSTTAPFDLQDVNVFVDRKNVNRWELREHKGDTVFDVLGGSVAVAKSPKWLLDEHQGWTEIFHSDGTGNVQSAYNQAKCLFYIVSPSEVVIYNPVTENMSKVPVADDRRVVSRSNHLTYDTVTNELVSYGISTQSTSRFDFENGSWSGFPGGGTDQPHYANHAYAENDSNSAYLFGGYGFYLYHNEFVKLNLVTGEMQRLELNPTPQPRMYASLCVVGDKLYIFGGFGNEPGKQEVPATNYYDLWEYDVNTLQGRRIGEVDFGKRHFLPSSQMYYSEKDDCFFFASTLYGGCMMKLTTDPMNVEVVSQPIRSNMDYRDCAFTLYRAKDKKTFYFVINKSLEDNTHDLRIYRITYPFAQLSQERDSDVAAVKSQPGSRTPIIVICVVMIAIIIGAVAFVRRRRRPNAPADDRIPDVTEDAPAGANVPEMPGEQDRTEIEPVAEPSAPQPVAEAEIHSEKHDSAASCCFRRDRSAISLLGKLEVRDKNGVDITTRLSSKMQRALIMLILYSEKDEKGVSGQTIDQDLWPDKDEKSAKKNRNVCIYKLRSFLEEVGDVEISYERGYYRINSQDACIDYHEVMRLFRVFEGDERLSGDNLERVIELLFFGPLLPSITLDYLDEFKSSYTDESLMILNKLLHIVRDVPGKQNQAYKIAETIIQHDPLNEDAIAAKCRILYARNMRGPAREAYDRFCREYEKSYGEEYNVPFSTILHPSESGQNPEA